MNTICFLLLTFYGVCTVLSNTAIPFDLRECYTNRTIWGSQLPMNLRVIIDIIRKAERYPYSSMNIRTISTSLLRRFKFDGVGFDEKVLPMNGILPFIADQPQRAKQEIVEEVIPGNRNAFPSDALTLLERCTLHQAISNTIWYHQLPNEDHFCIPGPTDKLIGRTSIKETKICPKENGVILTQFGTTALGNVINAIAASLEPQKVELNLLLSLTSQKYSDFPPENKTKDFGYNEEEVDLIIPKSQMNLERSMWIKSLSSTLTKLDNIWVATLAGELAEMVVYQGPIVRSEMSIGATGFWNSSMRPAIFYISNRRGFFDATRAEIIGSIDGLVIAKNLPKWFENFQSLRLSQVLEMYYFDRGFSFNKNIKACNRGRNFVHIAPGTVLEEQTLAVSKILAFRNGNVYMTDKAIQLFVNYATNAFTYYVNNHVFTESNCHRENPQPRVEIFVAFDGAWSRDYTIDFLSVLIDDVDVSMFGSKLGLIHGSSGEWLFNLTNSPASIHENLKNFKKIAWPVNFNYTAVLESIFKYLETAWKENEDKCKIGNIGQAVVLLTPRARLSETEEKSALNLIQEMKLKHPELYFLYFISESNTDVFTKFLISDEDRLIRSPFIRDISRLLLEVPVSLRPVYCKVNTRGVKTQMEDYITPQESITYKLHSQWRSNTKKITLTIHGVGYGTMEICTWTKWKINEAQKNFYCQRMTGFGDLKFLDFSKCSKKKTCPNLYYQVQNVTSLTKCAEMDCKSPDQVRYIIRIENSYYSHSQKILAQLNILLSTLLFYFVINFFYFSMN